MPSAPARICGCGQRVPAGMSCGVCSARRSAAYQKPERSQFYGTRAWRNVADVYRAFRSGVCECCGAFGSSHVDHIIPRSRGGSDEVHNLQLLCVPCHSRKSAEEGSRWGRAI